MWPGPSIGIIIKDLGVGGSGKGRGSCRCTSDVGLVPGPGRCTGRDIAREGALRAGLSHNLKYIGARCLSTSR